MQTDLLTVLIDSCGLTFFQFLGFVARQHFVHTPDNQYVLSLQREMTAHFSLNLAMASGVLNGMMSAFSPFPSPMLQHRQAVRTHHMGGASDRMIWSPTRS